MQRGPDDRNAIQSQAAELNLQLAQLAPLAGIEPAPAAGAPGEGDAPPLGDLEGLALDKALADLLQIAEGAPPPPPSDLLLPVADSPSSPPLADAEPPAEAVDHLSFAPSLAAVEPFVEPAPSPLALSESDLFGGEAAGQLLSLEGAPGAGRGADDLGFELFGGDILTASLPDDRLVIASADDPLATPPQPVASPGFFDLTGAAIKTTITPEVAAANVDKGYLLVQGDGDDTVILEGGWLDIAPYGSGQAIYQTFDGLYTVEIRDAAVFNGVVV